MDNVQMYGNIKKYNMPDDYKIQSTIFYMWYTDTSLY